MIENNANSVAAIILAAGFSSRMGQFKPLLPLGDATVIEQVATTFLSAGIKDIRVVTGHRAMEIKQALKSLPVEVIENLDYASGMFSSIKTGIRAIDRETKAFFLLPVDIPLIQPRTISRIRDAFQNKGIIYPCFGAERGHPPLIPTAYIERILSWEGDGGLRPLMELWEPEAIDLKVFDQGILMDMDTPEDYHRIKEKFRRREMPTDLECLALLKYEGVPEWIIRHCQAVSRVAVKIAQALDKAGHTLNLHLIEAASLLHDIARNKPNHASVGADYLRELNYTQVADIVQTHMDLPTPLNDKVTEATVLFMADKLVQEDTIVSLDQRFQQSRKKLAANPDIACHIESRFIQAQTIKKEIEGILGKDIATIIR